MAEVKCSTCGQLNPEDHNFCDHCAAPLFSFESLAEKEPSLLDSLASEDQEAAPPAPPVDDPSFPDPEPRIPSDDSLIANLRESAEAPPAEDDSSRLDDLVPAQPEEQTSPPTAPEDSSDEFSRLDDYLAPDPPPPDDLIDRMVPHDPPSEPTATEPEKESSPALDPFLEPDPRADLLGDLTPEEDTGESWDLFSEPESPPDQTLSQPEGIGSPGDWEYITPDPEPTPEKEELSDELDFLASLIADDPPPSQEKPAQEPDQEPDLDWDFLTSSSLKEPKMDPDTPAGDILAERDTLTSPSSEEPMTEPDSPADEPLADWDFLTSPSSEEPKTEPDAPADEPLADWDSLTSPSSEEPKAEPDAPADEPLADWDFLTSPSSNESGPVQSAPSEEPGEDRSLPGTPEPESTAPLPEHPVQEPAGGPEYIPESSSAQDAPGNLDFLAADTADGPITIGFSPDLDDEKDAIPDFGSTGFEEESGWMDMLAEPGERGASEPESMPEPKKPQTDWLDKIKRLNKSSDMVDEDSSFPDWLSVSDQAPREEPEISEPPPRAEIETTGGDPGSDSSLPDWLQIDDDDESLSEFLRKKDLTNEEYKPAIVRGITDNLPPQDDEADDDEPATGLSDSQQIKFPSWANQGDGEEKGKRKEIKPPTGQVEPAIPDMVDPFQMEEDNIDDLFSDELPGWLTSDPSESAFEDFNDELTTGDLPGWVEAMRPVVESTDASGLEDDEDYIENYGPLAGIPSVLPAEAEGVLDPDKVARKPLDLIATKSNQNFVEILKKLIADENKSKTIIKPAPVATQRVLRWLIALILLLTTAGTVIFGGDISTDPPSPAQIRNTGYGALYDQIEAIYDGQPVLIAFDYQPAAAGELHPAAAGVVDHLMKQGSSLSFVSTLPTGPSLAENFLETTQASHNYRHTQHYINLGYLPGGSAGLVSFVIAPKQIIPLAFDGSNAWEAPPLKDVDNITDFEMVLVITDDPDTAKIWIEQVGTVLQDKPLNMVVSAQVEPLIQPYFRSSPQLVNGYVAGIIDSMNYEQLLGRPNLANKVWLPFNLGIIIVVSTIFIGGLANGVLSIFSRHRISVRGAKKK